jgi:hypothetical protein
MTCFYPTFSLNAFALVRCSFHIAAMSRNHKSVFLRWPRTIVIKIFVRNEDFWVLWYIDMKAGDFLYSSYGQKEKEAGRHFA